MGKRPNSAPSASKPAIKIGARTTARDARSELSAAVRKGKALSQREMLDRGPTLWFQGTAAPAEQGTVALDTGLGSFVVIAENDVLAVEKQDSAFLVEVNVGANVLVRSESILKVTDCCTPPNELESKAPGNELEPKTPGWIAWAVCVGAYRLRCTWHIAPNGTRYKICWPVWDDCAFMAGKDWIHPTPD